MLYEIAHLGSNDYFKKIWGENLKFPSHLHGCFEFVVCLSGEMQIIVGGIEHTLHPNDALLIFPYQIHSYKDATGKCAICIFSDKNVSAFYKPKQDLKPINNKFTPPKELVAALFDCDENDLSLKKGLLYITCHSFNKVAQYTKNVNKDFLEKVLIYINQHFTEECSLKTVAAKLGYNKSYLSRNFKLSVGMNFNDYLTLIRLNHLCYLEENSNDTIINYALNSGFNSIRTFNRNFKKFYNTTPKEYFKGK